jgi:putative ABC transport system substrate-binding protein
VARQIGVKTVLFEARTRDETARAFTAMTQQRLPAVFLLPHPLFSSNRQLVPRLALQHRLPVSVTSVEMAEAGGLIAYAPDYTDQARRAATYVDKILKGASPAELPVQQPTKFELAINLKTAATLGIQVPPGLVLRADRVIE